MSVSLAKGQRVSLEKEAPGLTALKVGLGWDSRVTDGQDFDADASVLMIGADGKCIGSQGFVFYGALTSGCGSIVHEGDNLTGEGDGDDEVVNIDLSKIPENVERLIVAVTIHDAENRKQNFGQIENAFVRLVNASDLTEVARYDLSEDYSVETCVTFAEIYRKDNAWRVLAKGDGFSGGLAKLLDLYGLENS